VPITLEIAYMPSGALQTSSTKSNTKEQTSTNTNYAFPGIFFSSQVARFLRPVRNLIVGGTEWIGPLEQVNLSIATLTEDLRADSTHQEIDPLNILSIVANTIPFCNYN
jgi:DNA-directed RNA polymerase beta subunit